MVSIDKMIIKGKDIGGLPDCVQLDPPEAMLLLEEIKGLQEDKVGSDIIKSSITIVSTSTEIPSIFGFASLINDTGVEDIMKGWMKGEYEVKYKGIPLVIMERRG